MSLAIIAHGTNRCRSRDIWPSHSRCLTPSGWSRRSGQPCRAFRRPFRDSRPAPSTGRPRAFGSTLPSSRPFTVVVFAAVVASLEGRAQAGPAGHCRPLASRRVPGMVAPPRAAAAGKAAHRCRPARSYSAHARRERSVGRSANSRRVAEAWLHRLRTDRLAICSEQTEGSVADLADILRDPLRRPGPSLAGDVM